MVSLDCKDAVITSASLLAVIATRGEPIITIGTDRTVTMRDSGGHMVPVSLTTRQVDRLLACGTGGDGLVCVAAALAEIVADAHRTENKRDEGG